MQILATLLVVAVFFHSTTTNAFSPSVTRRSQQSTTATTTLFSSTDSEIHPAVADWPNRYQGPAEVAAAGGGTFHVGPRVLSSEFNVIKSAPPDLLEQLDVKHWPTWTTADKEKGNVGNLVADKTMPYGELSYMISGRLEIVPQGSSEATIVEPGDLVTFPEGFTASWKVLEEVTWHYYLY